MQRKKLTRATLTELAQRKEIISFEMQKTFVGGGDGSYGNPFTFEEYQQFHGGSSVYYYNNDNELCYNLPEVTVTGGANTSYNGGTDGGYQGGSYNGGTNGGYQGGSYDGETYQGGTSNNDNSYSINNAVDYLTSHANSSSTGYCARSVRQALEAGGISTDNRPSSACNYDTWLESKGFNVVNATGTYTPKVGDIVVFEALDGHPHGHIAMYNGQQWVSDFVQRDMYGGSAYRNNPDSKYTILRK